jgi:glycosyltransferase involved in cell wall biosynthesis
MDLYGRKTIKDGKTGLLVRPPEWEKALEKLVTDKAYREELGRNAREAVLKDWQYDSKLITGIVEEALK